MSIKSLIAAEALKRLDGAPVHRFVLEFGEEFLAGPLPKGLRLRKQKRCYANAADAVSANDSYRYAEGFAYSALQHALVGHAWCIWQGRAFDPTWRDWQDTKYFGISMSGPELSWLMRGSSYYGLLKHDSIAEFREKWRHLRSGAQ